ncbi:hypothetical protein [Sanguibacter sp. A246]
MSRRRRMLALLRVLVAGGVGVGVEPVSSSWGGKLGEARSTSGVVIVI